MIVAVVSNNKSIDSKAEGCFGKSKYLFVADTETRVVKIIDNSKFANLPNGSGIRTAELVVKLKVKKVSTSEIGKNALEILQNSNIEVFTNCKGTVREILDYFASLK